MEQRESVYEPIHQVISQLNKCVAAFRASAPSETEAGSVPPDTAKEVPSTSLVEVTPLQPETVPESAASVMEAEDRPADDPADHMPDDASLSVEDGRVRRDTGFSVSLRALDLRRQGHHQTASPIVEKMMNVSCGSKGDD